MNRTTGGNIFTNARALKSRDLVSFLDKINCNLNFQRFSSRIGK